MPVEITTWFPDLTAARLFVIVFYAWAASEVFNRLGFLRGRPATGTRRSDRGSYWIILLIVWGSILVSFLICVLGLGVFQGDLQYLGLGLAVLGIAVREWAVLALGTWVGALLVLVLSLAEYLYRVRIDLKLVSRLEFGRGR